MRILIADDEPVSRRLLERSLRSAGYDVVAFSEGLAVEEMLQSDSPPQLAVLDWLMPGRNGVEICRRLRAARRLPYVYLILLTAKSKDEDLSAALHAGADDFLRKPYKVSELLARVHAGERVLSLQDELIAAREQIRREASHDSLTSLLNRGAILDLLDRELARSARQASPLSVIIADLDHFKRTNDSYGHEGGDEVLREAARRMKNAVRSYDSAGRYGGEEFLFVLPGCKVEGAAQVADRLRSDLASDPVRLLDAKITVTASFGVAEYRSGLARSALITAADKALYRAKGLGRNRVECAAPTTSEATAPGSPHLEASQPSTDKQDDDTATPG